MQNKPMKCLAILLAMSVVIPLFGLPTLVEDASAATSIVDEDFTSLPLGNIAGANGWTVTYSSQGTGSSATVIAENPSIPATEGQGNVVKVTAGAGTSGYSLTQTLTTAQTGSISLKASVYIPTTLTTALVRIYDNSATPIQIAEIKFNAGTSICFATYNQGGNATVFANPAADTYARIGWNTVEMQFLHNGSVFTNAHYYLNGVKLYTGTNDVYSGLMTSGASAIKVIKFPVAQQCTIYVDDFMLSIIEELTPPTGLRWGSGVSKSISWTAVPNATSYTAYLYKNSVLVQTYTRCKETAIDCTADIDSGNYIFTVKAMGGGATSDSGVSVVSESKSFNTVVSPATLNISESTVLKAIDGSLFGISTEWSQAQSIMLQNTTTTDLAPDFSPAVRASGITMPLNRAAGTSANAMQWKKAIGTMAERSPQKMWSWESSVKQVYGPVEWITATRNADNTARFTWTLNLTTDTPQDCADLAEFFTGDGSNSNGGTNWAQRRMNLGIIKPVDVAVWELGNELDIGTSAISVQTYIDKCKLVIAAVRAVYPDAKFSAHARTAPWGVSTWYTWHQAVLAQLGNDINYIALHPYYLGNSLHYTETFIDKITQDIGTRPIKIHISEHAVWPSDYTDGRSVQTNSLKGVLGTAEFLNRLNKRSDVAFATYHNLSSGAWGVIRETNNVLWSTGIADMFSLYNQCYGNAVSFSLTGDYTDTTKDSGLYHTSMLTGLVSKQGDGLAVLLVNRWEDTQRNVTLNTQNTYRLVRTQTLTAPNLTDINSVSSKPITITAAVGSSRDVKSLAVPPKSMVLYFLKPIPAQGDISYDGAEFSCGRRLAVGTVSPIIYAYVGGQVSKSAKAYTALYHNARLEKLQITDVTFHAGASAVTLPAMNVADVSGRTMKVFVWDGNKPLGLASIAQ